MSNAMATQLAELIKRLEKALAGSPDSDGLFQINNSAGDVIEYLRLVATPLPGSDKTGSISAEPPSYPISREAAAKARTALPHAAPMQSAVAQQNWQKALDSAREIQKTMS